MKPFKGAPPQRPPLPAKSCLGQRVKSASTLSLISALTRARGVWPLNDALNSTLHLFVHKTSLIEAATNVSVSASIVRQVGEKAH